MHIYIYNLALNITLEEFGNAIKVAIFFGIENILTANIANIY